MSAGRLARVFLAAGLCVGCGSSQAEKPAAQAPAPTAREPTECERYGARMGPFLERFGGALDRYDGQLNAATDDAARGDAARGFSDFLHGELGELVAISTGAPEIARAHAQLVAALREVQIGLEQLATAQALDDKQIRRRALDRLADAWNGWSTASHAIVEVCGS